VSYASRDPLIGRTLDDRYRVRSRIARGGMGMVYLADDLRLGRKVAIKIMHPHLVDDESFVRRFEKEAHAAARLNDQNVVNVFDQGFDGEAPYLVMEYVPGITLRQLLKQQKRLTADQAIEISEAVLSGLSAAHQAGFIHRDVKPENVFLADDGRIKIGDFGLARATTANTTTGQALLGTIAYLSPELVTRGVADARSDIYAFGIMLYEMLTGVQPYRGEQAVQIAYKHAHEDVPKPSLVSSESTPELDEMVRWTTARDPELRPRDATVTLERMHHLLGTGLNASTRALPDEDAESDPSAATTRVIRQSEQDRIAQAQASAPKPPHLPETPLERLQHTAHKRNRRGRTVAIIVVLIAIIAAGVGWWFGQGPGANVTVPDISNSSMDDAQAALAELGLTVKHSSYCHSLDVPKGKAAKTTPAAGTRVAKASTVSVCESQGPRQLPVPTLIGLAQEDAEAKITEAHFAVGKVSDKQYSEHKAGTVLGALNKNGDPLGDSYSEQGVVDLVLSAGVIPDVANQPQDKAKEALKKAGLQVKEASDYSDDVDKGRVISTANEHDVMRPGDTITLSVSKGAEPVEVPDVVGKKFEEAVRILEDAGLTAKTEVPKLVWKAVRVDATDPEPGEEVDKGSEVKLKF
jgi:serine/threonine protein kinase